MAKKLMIMPSARSRYVKPEQMRLLYRILLVIAVVMVLNNYIMFGFMYGLKLALMVVVSIVLTREMEILFYSHDKDIDRHQAKELIEQSYYRNTGLIYALLIPIGTPLWLVGLGAVLATLLGKLLFGGFHHMVFHTSLVGYILLTEGWTNLVQGVKFTNGFDNYLLNLIFNNSFFNETLSLTRLFGGPNALYMAESSTSLALLQNGEIPDMLVLITGWIPGITVSGILLLGVLLFLVLKKVVNYVVPVTILATFVCTVLVFNQFNIDLMFAHLFSGSLLFVVVFVTTDPITTPIPTIGKVIFGVVVGGLTYFIRSAGEYEEGIVFAVLFMMMLTPLLNTVFKKQPAKKVVKKAPVKEGA